MDEKTRFSKYVMRFPTPFDKSACSVIHQWQMFVVAHRERYVCM